MPMRRLIPWLLGAFLLLLREDAFALGLLDGYHLALENDPQFQGAIQEHEAGKQYRALGRAALLPRLVYSYNRGRSWSDVTQATTRGDFKEERDYDSYVSTLSLQQPLFDYEAFSRYRKGMAQALLSDARFRSQSQELLVRVLEAYTGALLAQDQIDLARAQKRSYREQFQLNQRQFERGNGTRTDTLETQARFNLAQAQEIEARDSQDAALRELERLVGVPLEISDLAPLGERFQVRPLSPASYTAWRDLALAENPELASLRHAVDVARHEVEQNRADFLPRLGLYASTGKSKSGSENTYNQRYETDSVGIQLSIPLYSGGESLAATRQATHRMEKSHYDLDDKVRETLNQVRKMYNQSSSSAAKIRAYEMTVDSARTLVMATRKSIAAGMRVNLDLLNAEQALYSAMNELSRAKYDYLTAWARLRFYAGVLSEQDLEQVAANFVAGQAPPARDCATRDCPAPLHALSRADAQRSPLN
ncbi:TolC family outer membrane protein [Pseudomonas paraeruginosa]|uniref:TolC family outer membrane protein n=1 Tax=Pseudomonas paraeruginosa TaxID=2994495 RepID=UPI0039FD1D3A